MSYTPTEDKLRGIGFHAGETLSNGNQTYYKGEDQRIIVRHKPKKVRFKDEFNNCLLAVPSEEYFDLTIIALGWNE